MSEAVRHVEGEVRELIRRSGLDPARHPVEVDRLVRDAVSDYDERSVHGGMPTLASINDTVKSILDVVAGYGPLQRYFDDPTIEEIWINAPSKVFVARGGIAELTTTILTADEVRDLVERMLRSSGRRVDLSSPFVDATLSDGSRLHVVIPDITKDHWHINIRKFVVKADHLDDLVRLGTLEGLSTPRSTRGSGSAARLCATCPFRADLVEYRRNQVVACIMRASSYCASPSRTTAASAMRRI